MNNKQNFHHVNSYYRHGHPVKSYTRRKPYHYENPTFHMKQARLAFAKSAYTGYGLKGFKKGIPAVAEKVCGDTKGKTFPNNESKPHLSHPSLKKRTPLSPLASAFTKTPDLINACRKLGLALVDLDRVCMGQRSLYSDPSVPLDVRWRKYEADRQAYLALQRQIQFEKEFWEAIKEINREQRNKYLDSLLGRFKKI